MFFSVHLKIQNYILLSMVLLDLGIGGISAIISRTTTAPLELFKLQRQNSFMPHSTLRAVFKKEGFRYLWKGNGVNCIRAFPQFSINYAVFEYSKTHLFGSIENRQRRHFFAGGLSGMTALLCMYPLETIRSRLSLQICHNHYDSLKHAINKMSFKDLYRGLGMSLIGFGPYNALNFSFYFYLLSHFEKMNLNKSGQKLLAGGLSGILAVTITYPSDLIRRRLQLQGFDQAVPHYSGIIDCVTKIIRYEGYRGIYRGLLATYIKLFPTAAIQFWVIGRCNEEFKKKG